MSGVATLDKVDHQALASWIVAIDFRDWPQQVEGVPAMITDPLWHAFGPRSDPTVQALMTRHFGGHRDTQRMLSVVMPGRSIPPHIDRQPSYWITRVHVPLTTNDNSIFRSGGVDYRLKPGIAYSVDTRVEHAITNDGDTPRIHFMFDVWK